MQNHPHYAWNACGPTHAEFWEEAESKTNASKQTVNKYANHSLTINELKRPEAVVVVTVALLPMGKWRLPTGKDVFVCNRFPQTETAQGYFHGYIKKNKRTSHDSSWIEKYGLSAPWGGLANHKAECS